MGPAARSSLMPRPTECGFASPPADGTRDREIVDRFADFLAVAGPAVTKADIDAGRFRERSPAERYRVRFMAWRMSPAALDLAEQLANQGRGTR